MLFQRFHENCIMSNYKVVDNVILQSNIIIVFNHEGEGYESSWMLLQPILVKFLSCAMDNSRVINSNRLV